MANVKNSRYSPVKKKVTRNSKSTTFSNQSLKPADSISQAQSSKSKPNSVSQPKMSREELAQARIVRRQNTISLANRAVSAMTTTIHITDLLQMLSPSMRVEFMKALKGKNNDSSEPMQIANLAEQGPELSQATVAYISGDIDNVKFNNGILDTGSNINMLDKDFFNSLGFSIDKKPRYLIKSAGMNTLPIGEKKGIPVSIGDVTNAGDFLVIDNLNHPIVLGMPWIKQVRGVIDTNKDQFEMFDENGYLHFTPIRTERICNLAIQDFNECCSQAELKKN